MKLSKQQISALSRLSEAFKAAKKVGLQFAGMDNEIYYASQTAIAKCTPDFNKGWWREYSTVPKTCAIDSDKYQSECTGKVDTHGVYLDSGGW